MLLWDNNGDGYHEARSIWWCQVVSGCVGTVSNNEGKKDNKRNRNNSGSLHTFGLVDDSAVAAPLAAGAGSDEEEAVAAAAADVVLASSSVFFFCCCCCCFDAISYRLLL